VARGSARRDAAEIEEVPQIPAIIARLAPRTGIREGGRARIHVNPGSLHFLDPDTGNSLRGDERVLPHPPGDPVQQRAAGG
jgi:hypothetical protein